MELPDELQKPRPLTAWYRPRCDRNPVKMAVRSGWRLPKRQKLFRATGLVQANPPLRIARVENRIVLHVRYYRKGVITPTDGPALTLALTSAPVPIAPLKALTTASKRPVPASAS